MTIDRLDVAPQQMMTRHHTSRELQDILGQPMPHGLTIRQGDRTNFDITMQVDYLTARGQQAKFQRLEGAYTREITDIVFDVVARTRYTWDRISFSTGSSDDARSLEWTFARGQQFKFVLLAQAAAQYLSSDLARRDPEGEAVRREIAQREGLVDVAYRDLPRTAAVDLLTMFSWDVVTFENLLSHLLAEPGLRQVGALRELNGLSGSSTALGLSQYAEAQFRNGTVTAEFLGYGLAAGRPCAIFTFEATPSALHVGTGDSEVRHEGTSFYSGRLMVDVEHGDIASGHMVEKVVAVTAQPGGKSKTANVHRLVTLRRTTPFT